MQPKSKGDSIFLTAQADETTPIHEAIHTLGLGEFGAEVLTRLILRKNKAVNNMPILKGQLARKPAYVRVSESKDYPDAHTSRFGGRVEHYVLAPFVAAGDY